MKKKIAVIVSYVIEADRDDYMETDKKNDRSGFREDFVSGYNEKFPDEIQLTESLRGIRDGVSVIPLNQMNIEECPICGYLITDEEKPGAINMVAMKSINVQGINICHRCDFEIAYDIQLGRTVESIIEEVNSDKTMFNLHGEIFPKRLRRQKRPSDTGSANPNNETVAAIKEAIDIGNGAIPSKSYKSARELFDELDSEE